MAQTVEYISARELVSILKNSADKDTVRIIDVRDVDFSGGNIRGAINLPEDHFQDDEEVDEIVQEFKDISMVVFHCMMSQIRGPFCARRFQSRLHVQFEKNEKKTIVKVLYGGFNLFLREYKNDIELIENL